ncbi:MAG: PD-(D/E)XK nuclease family protein [Halioglobus sp.]
MPTDSTRKYFDLTRLRPSLEAGHLLVTPNQRLARRIKAEWDRQQVEQGRSVWQPVAVIALDHWLQQCWQSALVQGEVQPRIPLSALQEKELWTKVINADRQEHGQYSLLQTSSAADLAKQARSNLLRARLDMQASSVTSEFMLDQDCSTFRRWLQRFEGQLTKTNYASAEDRWLELLNCKVNADARPVVLVDFDDLPPLHRDCVEHLASTVKELASATGNAKISARSYADRPEELTAIARWAAQEYRQNPNCSLGVLLADMQGDRDPLEYLLRREFGNLGDNYGSLPINFSTGITLDRAPVIRDSLRMLASCGDALTMADILGLITSRFADNADAGSERAIKLLQQLFRDGAEQVNLGRLRYLSRSVKVGEERGLGLGDALAACGELRLQRSKQLPSAWVESFSKALDIWRWPGMGPLDSLEFQQVEAWYKVLEEFAALDPLLGKIDFNAAVALLKRCCQNRISQPQTADTGIQVLGPLEAAGLQFDSIWFCGLQGNRWPAQPRPNPFIPMALQRKHRMPHSSSEREWDYASTLTGQYRAGCDLLIASYSRTLDGVPELPSPLLEEFPVVCEETVTSIPAHWLAVAANSTLERITDHRGPAVTEAEQSSIRGGSGILQQQANCPFRAFASKRLFVEPLDEYRTGLSAADRGSILHDALYALWGELQDSETLKAQELLQLDEKISAAVASAIDAVPEAICQLVGMHCLDLESRRLQKLLIEWLEVERSREPFKVVAREEPISFQLGSLCLNMRVDRVDELADGSRLVIDYKSGRSSLSDWLGERPAQPQLPLYGLAENVAALSFAQVRTRDCRLLGLGSVAGIAGVQDDIPKAVKRYSAAEDWPALVVEWQQNLTRLAGEFLSGEAKVDPLPAACNYCGLQSFCRVDLAAEEVL